ncbi:hypothetical protein ACJW31_07G016500 [Castanea mollissima]
MQPYHYELGIIQLLAKRHPMKSRNCLSEFPRNHWVTHYHLQQVPVQSCVVFDDSKQKIPCLHFVSMTVNLCYRCDSLLVSFVSIFFPGQDFQVLDHLQMLLACNFFCFLPHSSCSAGSWAFLETPSTACASDKSSGS